MLKALGLDDADDVVPIYLGDDRTDEDAFKVLKGRATGFGILISNKVSSALTCSFCHSLTSFAQLTHSHTCTYSFAYSLTHPLTN